MRILKLASATFTIAALFSACTSSSPSDSVDETIAATSTTVRPDDGVLTIGAVLPHDGAAAELGLSLSGALALAVSEVNAAGGFGGTTVRLIEREEGDNEATASVAVLELIDLGVDAIIGPTSSNTTLATLATAVDAGILTCSPTASALALDAFPDNGLFFRTIASDSLQAQALAALVESSGTRSTVIVYIDDNYGRPFADATRQAVIAEGTAVTAMVGFTAGEASTADAVAQVIATQAEVVVVIADGTTGPAIISAIDDASTLSPTYVVNDAVRRPSATAPTFSRNLGARIEGVSPLAYPTSDTFLEALRAITPTTTALFAHNAYDCVNAIALAALVADSDRPSAIAGQISVVTDAGTPCNSFATCAEIFTSGRNIDYSGPGRDLTIGTDGDVVSAVFERFTFDADGRDVGVGLVNVGDD